MTTTNEPHTTVTQSPKLTLSFSFVVVYSTGLEKCTLTVPHRAVYIFKSPQMLFLLDLPFPNFWQPLNLLLLSSAASSSMLGSHSRKPLQ